MSSLFGILGVAERGMSVTSLGIRTAGHNIANVNTEGFSQQRQVTAPGFPINTDAGPLGTGVEQLTIERITDFFVQRQLMREGSRLGANDTQTQALREIETILDEQSGPGLSAALSSFYDSFDDLANATTPGAPVERAAVVTAGQALVDQFGSLDAQLRDVMVGLDNGIANAVPAINELTARIAELNEQIVATEVRAPANDLRDMRELAMRQLSELVDVQSYENDDGAVAVTLSNGAALVEGTSAKTLVTTGSPGNPFNPGFASVAVQDGGNLFDVTADIGSGRLGGLLRSRDTLVPAAIRSLDTLAYNLANSVNTVHQGGVGLDASTGNDFFTAPAAVEDAAANLALDATILASTDAIAAGTTSQSLDNRNAQTLAELRGQRSALFLPGDPPGPASGPSRSILEHAGAVISDIGQQSRTQQLSFDQQTRILEGLQSRRDSVSGVSIDEETTRLIELQAAFQANARVVSVVDTLMQDVLGLI
ncbi:MAG: flagellar hook-associated protein FlgK [Myxococcota bacterium]